MLRKILIISLIFSSALAQTATAAAFDAQQQGRALTRAFYDDEIETVWIRFNEQMQNALGSKEKFAAFAEQVDRDLGEEKTLLNETVSRQGEYEIYRRVVRFENAPMTFWVQWVFQDDGKVTGFFIKPAPQAAASDYLDYETKTALRLPFNGTWYVFWGGKKIENNYHAKSVDQRFAYDFLVMRDGSSHDGDGEQLDDYYCWGKTILAPGAGTVVAAVDKWPDNQPGVMDAEHPPGNHVIIDHGNGEYSLLAHMQEGSIVVAEGDAVEAGDKIGLCGNSGHTSEPHLHYHLQTADAFGKGQGLPAQFLSYMENGEFVERGIPVKGETISPAK